MDNIVFEATPQGGSKKVLVAVGLTTLVVGLVVGYLLNGGVGKKYDISSEAVNFRVEMNTLAMRHAEQLSELMHNGFSEVPNFASSADVLDSNSRKIDYLISSYTGTEEGHLLEIWRNGVNLFVNYIISMKRGDAETASGIISDIEINAESIANYLVSVLPSLDRDAVLLDIEQANKSLLESADSFSIGNFADSYDRKLVAETNLMMLADAISAEVAVSLAKSPSPAIDGSGE